MLTRNGCAGLKRGSDLTIRQFTNVSCDKARPEIAIGLQLMGRKADNAGMAGQIDGIGNDSSGGIRPCCGSRQYRDGIGDAERETAAMTAAGGDAARGVTGLDHKRSHHTRLIRSVHHTDRKLLPLGQMQRDVAAIVDVSALKRRCIQHRAQNLFGHGTGNGGHRGDEMLGGEWRHRIMHAACDDTPQQAPRRVGWLAQCRQFFAELIQQTGEAPGGGLIGGADIDLIALCFDDQVDRTVLQMQSLAVGEPRDLRKPRHAGRPEMTGIWRISVLSFSDASGRT